MPTNDAPVTSNLAPELFSRILPLEIVPLALIAPPRVAEILLSNTVSPLIEVVDSEPKNKAPAPSSSAVALLPLNKVSEIVAFLIIAAAPTPSAVLFLN